MKSTNQPIDNPNRVLPSSAPRYCFTNWLSQSRGAPRGARPRPAAPPPTTPADGPASAATAAVCGFLLHPDVRRHVIKLVYEDEWSRSMHESHPACDATDQALSQHAEGVGKARRALAAYQTEVERLAVACAAGGDAAAAVGAAVRWF